MGVQEQPAHVRPVAHELHRAASQQPGQLRGGPDTLGDVQELDRAPGKARDRKSTRLNSSHLVISYAVFCLKKKKTRSCFLVAVYIISNDCNYKPTTC